MFKTIDICSIGDIYSSKHLSDLVVRVYTTDFTNSFLLLDSLCEYICLNGLPTKSNSINF